MAKHIKNCKAEQKCQNISKRAYIIGQRWQNQLEDAKLNNKDK